MTLQGELKRIFTGWMFAASPGLNAVEHPIYDVWLTDCKGAAPPAVAEAPPPAPAPAQQQRRSGRSSRGSRARPSSAARRSSCRPRRDSSGSSFRRQQQDDGAFTPSEGRAIAWGATLVADGYGCASSTACAPVSAGPRLKAVKSASPTSAASSSLW